MKNNSAIKLKTVNFCNKVLLGMIIFWRIFCQFYYYSVCSQSLFSCPAPSGVKFYNFLSFIHSIQSFKYSVVLKLYFVMQNNTSFLSNIHAHSWKYQYFFRIRQRGKQFMKLLCQPGTCYQVAWHTILRWIVFLLEHPVYLISKILIKI